MKARSIISLDHPLLIAGAPALGYLIAYLDRLGEALAYGIPADYIYLSVTDALSRTSLAVVVATLLVLLSRLSCELEFRFPKWAANAIDTGTKWLLFSAFVLIFGTSLRIAHWIFLLGVFYVLLDVVVGFFRRRKHQESADRLICRTSLGLTACRLGPTRSGSRDSRLTPQWSM